MSLPKHYHQDWQRKRALQDPKWYANRKLERSEARREKKRRAVKYLGGKCHDCKHKYPWFVYDFHHKDPKRKSKRIRDRAANSLLMLKWETIQAELDVCVLLCSNCHRIRHDKEGYVKRRFKGK